MICDKCHGTTEVIRVTKRAAVNYREVGCRSCMEAWETVEVVDKSEPRRAWKTATGPYRSVPADTGSNVELLGGPSPSNEIKHLPTVPGDSRAVRGRGDCLTLFPESGTESDSSPTPSRSKRLTRKDKKRMPYSADFEKLWDHTGRSRGGKQSAWIAFLDVREGVTVDQMCKAWTAYIQSLSAESIAKGFVKELSTWLNAGGYDTEWKRATSPGVQQTERRPNYVRPF